MTYEFHPEAELDLYMKQSPATNRKFGALGSRFGDEVERVIGILIDHPQLGARVDADLRHFVLRKFPFSVV